MLDVPTCGIGRLAQIVEPVIQISRAIGLAMRQTNRVCVNAAFRCCLPARDFAIKAYRSVRER